MHTHTRKKKKKKDQHRQNNLKCKRIKVRSKSIPKHKQQSKLTTHAGLCKMCVRRGCSSPACQPKAKITLRPGPVHHTPWPGGGAKHTPHHQKECSRRQNNNTREGCPGNESLKPIEQDASRTQKTIAASRSAGGAPHAPLSASRAHPGVWGFGASGSLDSRGFTVTLIIARNVRLLPKAANRKRNTPIQVSIK